MPFRNIHLVNQQFQTLNSFQIWFKRINQDGFNSSKRMTLKTIQFLIWLKEWVNKSKKWEHSWKCVWSDQLEKTEHLLLVQSLLHPFLDNSMLILFLIQCKIYGLNQNITFLSCFCYLQVLILQARLMSLPERKRNLLKKFQWVKVNKSLQEELSSQAWSQETGLYFKTANLVLSSWNKSNNWLFLLVTQKLLNHMKTSDFGSLVNLIINSLLVYYKKSLKLQTSHQKV